jgi:hypothetical protein
MAYKREMDSIKDIFWHLDLGFSDGGEPGENVRLDTCAKHSEDLQLAIAFMHADESIQFSIGETLGRAHPSAHIYALDFPSDLRASLYLLLGGYYRQAIACLRNWLEMRLLGIHFARDPSEYERWKLGLVGKETGLFGVGAINKVFGRAEFEKVKGLRSRLSDLYGELSVFAHGQGLVRHDLQRDTDNVPRFNTHSVGIYMDLLTRTWIMVVYAACLAYGVSAFKVAGDETQKTVLEHMPSECQGDIRDALGMKALCDPDA